MPPKKKPSEKTITALPPATPGDLEKGDFAPEQYLFLLEFFVNHVSGPRLLKLNRMFCVPTCVVFRFLDFQDPELEVQPVDPLFQPRTGVADDPEVFRAGKSVVFAISRDSVRSRNLELKLHLEVLKRMPESINPDVLVGRGELDLSKEFAGLRKEILQCWIQGKPRPKTFEGDVELLLEDKVVGLASLRVGLSAFERVVTEFEGLQSPEGLQDRFLFRNEALEAIECRLIDVSDSGLCLEEDPGVQDSDPARLEQGLPKKMLCLPCGRTGAVQRLPGEGLPLESNLEPPRADFQHAREFQDPEGVPCGKAVVLKISGLLQDETGDKGTPGGRPTTVTVVPESEAHGPGKPPDPDHDVFVLRIGKKGLVGVGEKSELQLEMKTPKGPERRPPIRLETREMQTEDDKKGGKGGKGGKGKGKGKKKKK